VGGERPQVHRRLPGGEALLGCLEVFNSFV
jgi:hypothetical protein